MKESISKRFAFSIYLLSDGDRLSPAGIRLLESYLPEIEALERASAKSESDALARLRAKVEGWKSQAENTSQHKAKPADTFSNAPLALIQTSIETEIRVYELILAEIDASTKDKETPA